MADPKEALTSRERQQHHSRQDGKPEVELELEQGEEQRSEEDKEPEKSGQRHWHCVLLVEQLLDECWFWDNVVRWRPPPKPPLPVPTAPPDDASTCSIEMMAPLRRSHTLRRSLLQEDAKRRFADIRIQVPDRRLDDVTSLEKSSFLGDVEEEEGGEGVEEQHPFSEGPAPFPTKKRELGDRSGSRGEHLGADALLDWSTSRTTRRRRRDRRRGTRSLTELEIDELRGCRDLGFMPSKDDLTPRAVSMFPRLRAGATAAAGETDGEHAEASPRQQRVYASQAWLISRPDSPLLNWRVPAPDQPGVDMKKHLKFWVQAVVSTVRQEC